MLNEVCSTLILHHIDDDALSREVNMVIDHPIDHQSSIASFKDVFIFDEFEDEHKFIKSLLWSIFLVFVHVFKQVADKSIEAVDCFRLLVKPDLKCEFDLSYDVLFKILNFQHGLLVELIKLLNYALVSTETIEF